MGLRAYQGDIRVRNSTVVKLLLVSALGLALASSVVYAETAVDFDQGVADAALAFKQAKASVAAHPGAPVRPVRVAMRRYDRDCATFRFRPGDGLTSERVRLHSREWVEECYPTGDPRYGGGRTCHERPGWSYSETVQITLTDRLPLYPWEYDLFEVCLEGPWLDVYQRATAYDYRRVGGRRDGGDITLAPGKKLAMRPDPSGIRPELSGALVLTLNDKWASYYAGETTVVKLTLKREKENWFDPVLLEKEIAFPAAAAHQINLLAFADEFSEQARAGKKYYVKVDFQRKGSISKDVFVSAGETAPVPYTPVTQGIAGL